MTRKEWREVGKQSVYFALAIAGALLLIAGVDLVQSWPFENEKFIIILGAWLLVFSMFLGLSPFALDSKQKGMEYLLTLPYSRRRLLLIKLLPRLAAIVLFYLLFVVLYRLMGSDAYEGGFVFFSLAYFALFFISYSLSVVHENFIVQFIWAGISLVGYLALCLFVVMLGITWKFKMPAAWVGSDIWNDLSYDVPTLLVSIAIFLLMTLPFILSFFLAFKKFDLKPARVFNRRHLLIFIPLLLLAFALSLGGAYWVQKSSAMEDSEFYILSNQRLLKADFPGKLFLYDATGRRKVDTRGAVFWDRLLLEDGNKLYLSGYDTEDESELIGSLNLSDLSWKVLHRCSHRYIVSPGYLGIRYDGKHFVYLRRSQAEAELPGIDSTPIVRSDALELVRIDPVSGETRTIAFRSPLFSKYYEPWFYGIGELNGMRFWLVAHKWSSVLRLWEDGRVEDLGVSKGFPVYVNGLLFCRGEHSLRVQRLLDANAGSETVKEIEGKFWLGNPFFTSFLLSKQMGEMYAERDKRIVRIDLATLAIDDVGPARGHIWLAPSGDYYYVEFENWPSGNTDTWEKLYRLQNGKMVFLKQFDFGDAGYGHIDMSTYGITFWQHKIVNQNSKITTRFFAFPDLKELKFKDLN